ncbi:MAG TPA: Fur family transcriptional regulator [Candidatus Eremiobacteraeota bacterium]|nr:MAG: Peroxide-responsive repressor PerR [bacterium ADurb.Bin363]HPZ08239.1 Fur family transcriptional regulator [Candidatus Eremiobacteraeota bacterium]
MDNKFELLKEICKNHGVKLTYQKLEIFREIIKAKNHPSVEDIYNRVKVNMPTISIDTVYRSLNTFYSWGLISKVHIFCDKARFDSNTRLHHHMLCTECEKLWDFYWPEFYSIELPAEVKEWGNIEGQFVEIRGICRECLKESETSR